MSEADVRGIGEMPRGIEDAVAQIVHSGVHLRHIDVARPGRIRGDGPDNVGAHRETGESRDVGRFKAEGEPARPREIRGDEAPAAVRGVVDDKIAEVNEGDVDITLRSDDGMGRVDKSYTGVNSRPGVRGIEDHRLGETAAG